MYIQDAHTFFSFLFFTALFFFSLLSSQNWICITNIYDDEQATTSFFTHTHTHTDSIIERLIEKIFSVFLLPSSRHVVVVVSYDWLKCVSSSSSWLLLKTSIFFLSIQSIHNQFIRSIMSINWSVSWIWFFFVWLNTIYVVVVVIYDH